jgi:uncharacterized membrane protein
VPLPLAARAAALAYVLLVAVLGALSFSSDQARPSVEWPAFLLLLPTVVLTLPVMYGVGAIAWSIRDAIPGQPMWPVTVTFTLLFAGAAVVNVVVIWFLLSRSRLRRRGGTTPSRVTRR